MQKVLQVGGVWPANGQKITVEPDDPTLQGLAKPDGFLIKGWDFANQGNTGILGYSHMAVPVGVHAGGQWNYFDNQQYNWRYSEVTDQQGLPGQGQTDPPSWFLNHALLLVNGIYYDPSYGLTHTSRANFEENVVAGYWKRYPAHPGRTYNENEFGQDLNGNLNDTDNAAQFDLFGISKGPGVFNVKFV